MMEDKDPDKIHNKSGNRYDHQSIMLHLWGLKSPLRNRQDKTLRHATHHGSSHLTSIASENMKNAMNRRKRALTNPATTSALTYLHSNTNAHISI